MTTTVCANCEDYVDDPRLKRHGSGWRHVVNNSVRCPGQEDDDTDDRAEPVERDLGSTAPPPDAVSDGLAAARAFTQWHLGSSRWADLVIDAQAHPAKTWKVLADAGMRLAQEHLDELS